MMTGGKLIIAKADPDLSIGYYACPQDHLSWLQGPSRQYFFSRSAECDMARPDTAKILDAPVPLQWLIAVASKAVWTVTGNRAFN
jgi:hypothetical protein